MATDTFPGSLVLTDTSVAVSEEERGRFPFLHEAQQSNSTPYTLNRNSTSTKIK